MRKTLLTLSLLLLCSLQINSAIAQEETTLLATYQSDFARPSAVENVKNESVRNMILNELRKQNEVYTLYVHNNQYAFTRVPLVEKMVIVKGKNSCYADIKSQTMLSCERITDRFFTVKEPIQKIDWKITDQDTTILDQRCVKATASFTIVNLEGETTGEWPIEAWFCPDIPEPYGPAGYCGLPGLVFYVKTPDVIYTLTGVDFSEQNFEIVKPTGETVGREEFEKTKQKVLSKYR